MRYDFKCLECLTVFEESMTLKQYENWRKGKFPITCPNCKNRSTDYERIFPTSVGLKFIGNWYSTTKEY